MKPVIRLCDARALATPDGPAGEIVMPSSIDPARLLDGIEARLWQLQTLAGTECPSTSALGRELEVAFLERLAGRIGRVR